jgi:hypothetical protein
VTSIETIETFGSKKEKVSARNVSFSSKKVQRSSITETFVSIDDTFT